MSDVRSRTPPPGEPHHSPAAARELNQKLASGAFVSGLGTLAKAAVPLIFLIMARLYGPALLGAYAISTATTRFLESLLTAGFRDAMVMYGARHAHRTEQDQKHRLYQAVSNAVVIALGVSVLAVAVVVAFPGLLRLAFADDAVGRALRIGIWALPFTNLREIALAMIRSQMVMRYDALVNGVIGPLSLLLLVGVGGLIAPRLDVLMWLWVSTEVITCFVAVFKASQLFDWSLVLLHIRRFELDRPLLSFALPQNLNSTFNHFATSLDVVMLGLFGVRTELIGFYSIIGRVLRDLRSPRRSFSAVLSPLVARLHHERRLNELSYHFATTSRWVLTLTIPAAFAIMVLLPDVLRLLHSSYTYDMGFAVLLVVDPVLAGGLGLAGNVLVMTGHSRVNLLNSTIAAVANVALNVLLIPPLGLTGAALATMSAGVFITVLQVLEARHLVGLRADLPALRKPFLAGCAALAVVILGQSLGLAPDSTGPRVLYALAGLVVYALVLRVQGLDLEDRHMIFDLLLRVRKRKRSRQGALATTGPDQQTAVPDHQTAVPVHQTAVPPFDAGSSRDKNGPNAK